MGWGGGWVEDEMEGNWVWGELTGGAGGERPREYLGVSSEFSFKEVFYEETGGYGVEMGGKGRGCVFIW